MEHLVALFVFALLTFAANADPGTWKVDKNDKACLLLDMNLDFTVDYQDKDDKPLKAKFSLPTNASVDDSGSGCEDKQANITLSFFSEDYSILLSFKKMTNDYSLAEIEFKYKEDSDRFPNSKAPSEPRTKKGPSSLFQTPTGSAYRCNAAPSEQSITGLELAFSNVKLQPFGVNDNGTFSKEYVCDADKTTTTAVPTTTMAMPTTNATTMPKTNATTMPVTMNSTVTGTTMVTNISTEIMTTVIDINGTTTEGPSMTTKPSTTVTPTSPPTAGNWSVNDANGKRCMNMAFSAYFTFSYQDAMNKSKTENVTLPVTADPSMSNCESNTTSEFILEFNRNGTWTVMMMFEKISSNSYDKIKNDFNAFQMSQLNITYFDNLGNENEASTDKAYFVTKLDKTYKCDAGEVITLQDMNVTFSDVRFQPFANGTKHPGGFEDCKSDDKSSNIVPIAVGCALAGLVVIVLIAYLIGRKRTKSVGYQTV